MGFFNFKKRKEEADEQLFASITTDNSTSIQQMMQQMGLGTSLTKEEKQELEALRQDYNSQIKSLKIAEFKKLPSNFRQFVIYSLTWSDVLNTLNDVKVDKDQRLIDLENKELQINMFNVSTTAPWLYANNNASIDPTAFKHLLTMVGLPEGVLATDLQQAHLEATIEEEMLNDQ